MQRALLTKQISEAFDELEKSIDVFKKQSHFNSKEAEQALENIEKLYRALAVYTHNVKQNEISADLNVHVKIMQAIEVKEEVKIQTETRAKEVVQLGIEDSIAETVKEVKTEDSSKKMEIAINDKYRFINELFGQNQSEFNAALQQVNAASNIEDATRYLESLKQLYNWKEENPLVKTFISVAQKRFH